MRRPVRVTIGWAAGMAVAGLLLAGCGDDDPDPRADQPPSASSAATPTTPASSTPPSAEPSTGFTDLPATGQLIDLEFLSLHVPAGFPVDDGIETDDNAVTMVSEDFRQTVLIGSSSDGSERDLDEQAEDWIVASGYERPQKKLPPVLIAGLEWFHLDGRVDSTKVAETFGINYRGQRITVTFEYLNGIRPAKAEQTTGSVLSSVVLKG